MTAAIIPRSWTWQIRSHHRGLPRIDRSLQSNLSNGPELWLALSLRFARHRANSPQAINRAKLYLAAARDPIEMVQAERTARRRYYRRSIWPNANI